MTIPITIENGSKVTLVGSQDEVETGWAVTIYAPYRLVDGFRAEPEPDANGSLVYLFSAARSLDLTRIIWSDQVTTR